MTTSTLPAPTLWQSKLKACSIHLVLSALAVGALAAITLGIWYPSGLAELQGVWKILAILVGVDLVLGPMLTFLVYAPKKRSLVFDLSVIAALQIAALVYGAWIISLQRPAYLAFMYDRFFIVTERDIIGDKPAEVDAIERWRGGPRPVFVRLSFAAQRQAAEMAKTALDTPAMALLPGGYAPLASHTEAILSMSENASDDADGPASVPVVGRNGRGYAILKRDTAEILKIQSETP